MTDFHDDFLRNLTFGGPIRLRIFTAPDLASLTTFEELAGALNLPPADYVRYVESRALFSSTHSVSRGARRQARTIHAFRDPIRHAHKRVALWAQSVYEPPSLVTGFVKQCSHIKNAKVHLCAQFVTVLDIRGFFDSITASHVRKVFSSRGCSEAVTEALTELCTLEDRLPQGSRASPLLSNMVCTKLDNELAEFAASHDLKVTRYVDDIAFSGDSAPSEKDISELLFRHGFELKSDSYRVQRKGGPQYVTGLCVADHESGLVRLPRRYKTEIEESLHELSQTQGLLSDALDDPVSYYGWATGNLKYSHSVEPGWVERVSTRYGGLLYRLEEEINDRWDEPEDVGEYY